MLIDTYKLLIDIVNKLLLIMIILIGHVR